MIKVTLLAILLCIIAGEPFAQTAAAASAPEVPASAPVKHKLLKKLKNHKPGASAVNPESSAFKQGGQ